MSHAPPLTSLEGLDSQLREHGFAVVNADSVCRRAGVRLDELAAWQPGWDSLPPDLYLKDGGHYRRRRHANLVVDRDRVVPAPHRAHWQPVHYNALHGGMERWFEPMSAEVITSPAWQSLMAALGRTASALRGSQPWYVEAHQFRIDTAGGIGRPTPEGAHRDGVDLVAVFLVAREGIKGGETRVFHADRPAGMRFTLSEPWSVLLLDDARMVHETTPIQPEGRDGGYRDTLVVTLRAGGFQGPGA